MSRFRWLAVVGTALTAVLAIAGGSFAGAGGGGLSKADHVRLAGTSGSARLMVATRQGATESVAGAIRELGGTIEYSERSLGYLRVSVDAGQADKVASLAGVEAAELDSVIPLPDPRPDADGTLVDPPGPGTPGANPYMPTADTGAQQFVAANPKYDGRGVVIGIVDTGIDLLTPELQTAKAINGKAVPKIAGWVTGTDPVTDNDPTWVSMSTEVSGPTFTVGEGAAAKTNTTPAGFTSGFFGTFNESSLGAGSEFGGCPGGTPPANTGADIDRDGTCGEIFGLLWDGADTVWVDTNTDLSFADQMAMSNDGKKAFTIDQFGTDNPATMVRETVPYVVQVDNRGFVNIGIVSGAHGTHVAGIAAGKDFFEATTAGNKDTNDPQYDGAAPEAQIVSSRACLFVAGCTAHALFEGMIYMAKTLKPDVINMSIGGLPALNDGNNARAILYSRLIDLYRVQMFISAGNSGPGVNAVGDPSVATKVMSVAASLTKETLLNNYGNVGAVDEQVFLFSSRGPREDGGFKPNIAAPGAAVSTTPKWQPQQCLAYACPPGYGMFNGTSMAAPQATGGAALLISAAKQTGAQYAPDQLRLAINSSTRWIPGFQAIEQGNGELNVGAAWDLLKQNLKPVDISSVAPVNTVLSGFLATPAFGPGIYEREGWEPGETGSRTISLKRQGGNATYNLTLVGGDGTFAITGPTSVTLGSADVTLSVTPATAGVHSAILNVDDPSTLGIDYQVLNTVIAAEQLTAGNNYTVTTPGSVARFNGARFFFNVPEGTPTLKIDVAATTGRIRWFRYHPFGVPIDPSSTGFFNGPGTQTRTVADPTPGVWEVTVEASRAAVPEFSDFSVTATLLGATVTPDPDVIEAATIGVPIARSYTLTNVFGPFTGRAVGTTLGSAFIDRPEIANHAQQEFDVNVTAGSTSLRATIGNPEDPSADLDLFVFNCTTGTCVLAGQNADGDSEESVTIAAPAAGLWKVLVDGFAVPAGTTEYDYIDLFVNPAFGSVSVTDANALRPAASVWTVPGSVTANAAPAAGRVLFGNVDVRTDTNVLVGRGDVIVESVTP